MKKWIKRKIRLKQKSAIKHISDIVERQQELREHLGKYYEESTEYQLLEVKKNWLYIVAKILHIWSV